MAHAAAVGIANEGAKLFTAGDFAAAAERFTAALDALRAVDPATADCCDADTAQAALSRARALNNRATCHLRLGAPLAALDDTADALSLLADPRRLASGVPAARPGGAGFAAEALGILLTTVLKRAAAYEAAGTPVAALPLVAWGEAQRASAQASKLRDVLVKLRRTELAPLPAAGKPGVVPAHGMLMQLAGRTGCPPGRRGGVGAVVAGHLYVIGGQRDDFSDAPEFWRVPVANPAGPRGRAWDWERLPTPSTAGGPSSTGHALLCASHATRELLCLTDCKLWALSCDGPDLASAKWRDLGLPWPGAEDDGDDINGAAFTALGDAALVYSPDYGLVSINLRTGTRDVLWKVPPYAGQALWTVPWANAPHLWPCGSSALLLWGGSAPDGRYSTELPGHHLISPPPLGDMWRFELASRSWARVPRGGGGVPPAPRAEAALAPLIGGGFEDGSAVLLGGYSELLPQAGDSLLPPTAHRYCDDAHMYTPSAGWRRLAPTGPRAPPAAALAAGFFPLAEGGSVVFCGGYSSIDGMLSHAQVSMLGLRPEIMSGSSALPDTATAGPARDALLIRAATLLLSLPSDLPRQMPWMPLPPELFINVRYDDRDHNEVDWAALLARARALPRGEPASQMCITWQETVICDDPRIPPVFQMTTSRNEVPSRACDATDFFFDEPDPTSVARHMLLSIVPPAGARQLPRPRSVLFAARLGGATMRACMSLLELLEVSPTLEPWHAAAESSLMHDTNPWGYNAVRRCVRCRRAADGHMPSEKPVAPGGPKYKLRSCAACKLATYCSSECQKADWVHHKEMCRFTQQWKQQNGKM